MQACECVVGALGLRPPDLYSGLNTGPREVPEGSASLSSGIFSPCLFNLYAEYLMRNTGLDEAQAAIKIAGRNINNLRYADDTTIMAESEDYCLDSFEHYFS